MTDQKIIKNPVQKSFNKRVKKLGKKALQIINGRYHAQNRNRDTLNRLYKEGIYAENMALTEEAYENQFFSSEWLNLQRVLSNPAYYTEKERIKRRAGIMLATNGIREKLTKEEIAKRVGTNRQNLNRWKNDPFHKETHEMFWGTKSTEE